MSEPTTAAEALAEAIFVATFDSDHDWRADWREHEQWWRDGVSAGVHPRRAQRVLDALPDGWRLVEAQPATDTAAEALMAAAEVSGVSISKGIQRDRHPDPEGLLLWALATAGWALVRTTGSAGRPPQPGTGETTTPAAIEAPGPPSAPVEGCPACTDRERA